MIILVWVVLGLVGVMIAAILFAIPSEDALLTLIIGEVGAFLGGLIGSLRSGVGMDLSIWSVGVSFAGAIVLLLYYWLSHGRPWALRIRV